MLVVPLFEGDAEVDSYVMWVQHDVYHSALWTVANTCQKYERYARRILGIDDFVEHVREFDHRALQDAHDILAAVWRYRWELKVRQFSLHFEGGEHIDEPCFSRHWLSWLRDEVRTWLERPYLIREVIKILHNINSAEGYKSEAQLCWDLLQDYDDVPWTNSSKRRWTG